MTGLKIAGLDVRLDDAGRFSLNDLHRAGGSKPKHRPSLWLANQQTQDLVDELDAEAGNPALVVQRGGSTSGSYGCREIALAYAAWISPAFHVKVLRAADAVLSDRVEPAQSLQAALSDPTTLRALLLEHADARLALEQQVKDLVPRVAAIERLTDTGASLSLTAAAKALHVRPREFMAWLATTGWTYRAGGFGDWQAHQKRIDAGYLTHVMVEVGRTGGSQLKAQVKVTPKGLAKLAELLQTPNAPALAA